MASRKPTSAAAGRSDFAALLADVKGRIQAAQTRAVLAVNGELVRLYWDIGRIIVDRQRREGWGAAVIPRLALKLKNELPDRKGFSERNIDRMIAFCRGYPIPSDFSPPAVAKSAMAGKEFKDPYLFDFLGTADVGREREGDQPTLVDTLPPLEAIEVQLAPSPRTSWSSGMARTKCAKQERNHAA